MNDISATIKYLQKYIKSKDCNPKQIKDYFLKLTEETGELAEAIRKNFRANGENIKGTVGEEIWDIMYYCIAIANCYDIDLDDVIAKKECINNQKYNTGIEYRPND
ncbi:MAG: MazG nucleotide pyrophosphohydrolase domain-containing protein [Eubacterium sp.]